MFFLLFFCSAMLIISEQSENSTLVPLNLKDNSDSALDIKYNKTNLPLVSEGGILVSNTSEILLKKTNFTNYLSLDDEIMDKPKEKSSVPRKGVDNLLPADSKVSLQFHSNDSLRDGQEKHNTDTNNLSVIQADTNVKHNINTDDSKNKKLEQKKPIPTVHKKPTILSFEALANMEKNLKRDESKIPVVPSTKTMASNQIPSPNEDSIVKIYSTSANNHPGMIMPVVITILVVPMFAIVGFMALRRGQEAWKNRHYKRMDFLLDGMYND